MKTVSQLGMVLALGVDGALVIKTDVAASNGVIHVLDTALLPKG